MSIFGDAKFGTGKRNWYKLKDGTNGPYRILPPIGDCREDGRWSQYYKIHYGYRNSKNEMRTFESPEVKNRKTKMIDVPDAALNRINFLKGKLKEAQDTKNTHAAEELLKLVGGKKSQFNLDANHYMNVVDTQGNIGILKIRHRAKLALDAKIKELRDNNIDPLHPKTGRYFIFTRTGSGSETVYSVSVATRTLNVEGVGEVKQDLVHEITEDLARRCAVQNKDGSFTYKEAARLDTLFKRPTAEEVERIVKEGAPAVDEILDGTLASSGSDADESGVEDDESSTEQTSPAPTATQTLTTAPSTPAAATVTTSSQVTPPNVTTPAPAAVVTPPTAPKTTAQTISPQSDEDFLKSLNL